MKLRPSLRPGDVVKLSKKGRSYSRSFPKSATMVVSEVSGDGIDRASIITCRVELSYGYETHKFYRSELWYAGINVFGKQVRILNFKKQST